jgi:NAD(P)-dependent dehydrogenase (short-subunit alcohol dehydrogenase family)
MNYTSDSSTESTETLANDISNEFHVKTLVVQADMGSENGPAHIVARAKNHFRHPKSKKFQIDIIIQNAGVSGNNLIQDITAEEFAFQYNVNVRGPIFLLQAALPYLPNDRSGRIVSLSSVSSSLGFPGQTVYGGTKAALDEMTRTWARELSERCTVNTVNPGPVATDMYGSNPDYFKQMMVNFMGTTPLAVAREGSDPPEIVEAAKKEGGRPAYPHEIAGIVAMLCTPDAGWCTGSVICANGGMRMSM